jgi:polyhydroxyalkanoate synthase
LAVWTLPLDFSRMPIPDTWIEALRNNELNPERLCEVYDVIPAHYMKWMFQISTYPVYFSHYVGLLQHSLNEAYVDKWRRLNKWTSEHIPFAAKAYQQMVSELFKQNKLVKGELIIRGKKVDLSQIRANLLCVSAKKDHIVLEEQARPIIDLVSSKDKTYEVIDSGHVSLVLTKTFQQLLGDWLASRSQPTEA